MRLIILIFLIFLPISAKSNEILTIYTYDSFISEWGPGPTIKQRFKEKYNHEIKFVSSDSSSSLLSKIILEGPSTKADIVLGLDMNLLVQAKETNLFSKHSLNNLNEKINLPIKWTDKIFVPFNYGYFAFVYNNKLFTKVPTSMDELINKTEGRIVIQDPRTSSPGLGLLTWIKLLYGKNAEKEWVKLNKKIVSVTKGWTDSYYNIFLTGEADLVLSYTTSPAAHIMFENDYNYSAINFTEGNYLTIEFAGILKSSNNKDVANKFLNFMISEDFQSLIPTTNIMYPVINLKKYPDAYNQIKIPTKSLQMDPVKLNINKEKWIEEWLSAL